MLNILTLQSELIDTRIMSIILILTTITSISSLILFFYENSKRQKNKSQSRNEINLLKGSFEDLKAEHEKLNIKENILSQIINCANKALEEDDVFQISMKKLANTLRNTFESEYCAIGKVLNDTVEDYACDYDKHTDKELQKLQENSFNKTRKVIIRNTEYLVCEALNDKAQPIIIFNEEDIKKKHNSHYELYKTILKSGKLSNTTIIPLRNNESENIGYIQFINSENIISIDRIKQFQDSLLQLVQMVIEKEKDKIKIDINKKFIDDSNLIKKIIQQKDDIDLLLDSVMEYMTKEFNASVISFRIPVLNGKEREPFFYLRRCYVNPTKTKYADEIKKHYYTNRLIKKKNELGGFGQLKCRNNGDIIVENSMDSDYYSDFGLDLKEQTLIIPVLKDFDKSECLRIENNPFCEWHENEDCVERFKKLYGLFKLRLSKSDIIQDADVTEQEENSLLTETKKRLSYLSGQITLILNSILDKIENDSLKIFRENLKGQQFLKIRDFDNQFVEIIKRSTRAKECSIYRYKKNDDYSEHIHLSATTSKKILYNGVEHNIDTIIHHIYFSISDKTSIIVRVFHEKKSLYLYNLHNEVNVENYIELINGNPNKTQDESVFFIPIIKKDEEETCLGVVVLLGKQKDKLNISGSYWEQDKSLIEFIVEMFTRISEADNERLTFLGQLRHELLVPISEVVQENDFLFNKYEIRKDYFNKREVIEQLRNNLDNSFLFKSIITDIDLIYSSSIRDIFYRIELQKEPKKILQQIITFFRTEIPIHLAISEMPSLYMDKDKIKQVFINILKNAIKYSYKESYRRRQIEIYYKSPDESDTKQHEIRFVNYGIGILKEDKDRIFELYKRGKNASDYGGSPSGSGMGLYIVKEIMKAHGGDCIIRKLKDPTEISLIFPKETNQ